uniref:Uncharacterized protein n=1 Tax=Melopsittacus undulatus TaxID=13146 RepID=A0A8V5HI52_MELUD
MSESSAKSSQPLASKGDKDVSEKRGRGRPRKKPQEPSEAPTPKRPRGRPKGSKNKATPKGRVGAGDAPAELRFELNYKQFGADLLLGRCGGGDGSDPQGRGGICVCQDEDSSKEPVCKTRDSHPAPTL